MSNMSYVRFENTLRNLKDCYDHINDDVNGREAKHRSDMIKLCVQIAEEYWEPE